MKVYRRHLLHTNGLDPELVNVTRDKPQGRHAQRVREDLPHD